MIQSNSRGRTSRREQTLTRVVDVRVRKRRLICLLTNCLRANRRLVMNLRVRTVHALSAMVMVQCCCCDGAAGREARRAVLVFCERASPLALSPPYLPRPNPNLLPTSSLLPTYLFRTYLSFSYRLLCIYRLTRPTYLPACLPPLVNFKMDGFTRGSKTKETPK